MFSKFFSRKNNVPTRLVFVLGTGRSGTHWLGYTLKAHSDFAVAIEKEPAFGWVKEMALRQNSRDELLPKLAEYYEQEAAICKKAFYVDKSHPNIWIADRLANLLPGSLFCGY